MSLSFSVANFTNAAEPNFPPECPAKGSMEIIAKPTLWADSCFKALNGRLPSEFNIGETSSVYRDIDLDGTAELLEIQTNLCVSAI